MRDAAATLAAAFHGGRLFGWALPDPTARVRRLPWLFASILRHCRAEGRVLAADGADAVAGWVPGGHVELSAVQLVRSGLAAAPIRLGPVATVRVERHEQPANRRVAAAITPATAYLWVLGVAPDRHGAGLGSGLLRRVVDDAAAQGYDRVVLRTDDPGNVAFYHRNGFEVVEALEGLPSGLPSWVLAATTR